MDSNKPKGKKPRKAGSNKNDEVNEPLSEIKKADTEAMEVHHHPELPHGEKKRFKEYLLEGLMIFIAVTMGFFAESLREHINNKDKETGYITSFAQDLRSDSTNLCVVLSKLNANINDIDSLITLLNSPERDKNGARMYYYSRNATRNLTFQANERTISQLQNAGGFSIMKNKTVIDSIIVYEEQINRYKISNTISLQEGQLLYPFIAKIFKATVFQSMITADYQLVMPKGNPQLLSNDPVIINELTYYLHQRNSTQIFERVYLMKIQASEKRIYNFLDKTYDLKD